MRKLIFLTSLSVAAIVILIVSVTVPATEKLIYVGSMIGMITGG